MFFIRKIYIVYTLLFLAIFSCKKPQGLQFTGFSNFKVEPVSLANSNVMLGIGVYNPNNFDIKVNHLNADISLAGKQIGNYQLDSSMVLKANQPFVLPVKLSVKNGNLLGNAFNLFTGDSIPYSVSGKVKAGRKMIMAEIPFSYSGHLSQKDFNF